MFGVGRGQQARWMLSGQVADSGKCFTDAWNASSLPYIIILRGKKSPQSHPKRKMNTFALGTTFNECESLRVLRPCPWSLFRSLLCSRSSLPRHYSQLEIAMHSHYPSNQFRNLVTDFINNSFEGYSVGWQHSFWINKPAFLISIMFSIATNLTLFFRDLATD